MRIPSRQMPAYTRTAPSRLGVVIGWSLIGLFICTPPVAIYIGVAALNISSVVVGTLLLFVWLIAWVHEKSRKARLKSIAALRAGQSICQFAGEFDPRETDTWVIRAVYEQIQMSYTNTYPIFDCARMTNSMDSSNQIRTISTSISHPQYHIEPAAH